MLAGPTEPLGCHLCPHLQLAVSVSRESSMAETFAASASRADRAGLSPGRWVSPGWFRAAARASSAGVPSPVRCHGLGFAQGDPLNHFTVLCQVTGAFGGAAMAGAGAVPGQALSPGPSPHDRAAARALLRLQRCCTALSATTE